MHFGSNICLSGNFCDWKFGISPFIFNMNQLIRFNFMKINFICYCLRLFIIAILTTTAFSTLAKGKYKGRAWNDTIQQIPGKIQCEFYDLGGEGVAYHDSDSINNGSGMLNPSDGQFLNEFRKGEGVDISYTKFRNPPIDNNSFNVVEPIMNQLYVGWTVPGEWINYMVKVNKTGTYDVGFMYTASGDGGILLEIDGKPITTVLLIPSTRNDKEPVGWRQWHHWNRIEKITQVNLIEGIRILTLKTVRNGNMNYDYLDFKLIN